MTLFQEAVSTQAKAKIGIYGGTGSGKTFTAALIAIGLHKHLNAKKPVFFLDTETGSDFVLPMFKKAGIKLNVAKTRSFPDLLEGVRVAEREGSILITDSITHYWDDFIKGYLKKTGQKFVEIWDWKPLKQTWQEFTDLFVNSDVHFIMCGRAASVYETSEEVKDGKTRKTAVKVGTKMRTESEGGYEPSLLLEMEKVFLGADEANGKYVRVCHVVKDRFNVIDSQDFENPTFENILPHINLLNLDGTQLGIDTSRTSEGIFDGFGNSDRDRRVKRRAILCEELTALLLHYIPGAGAKEKDARQEIVYKRLGTRSWTAVESDWTAVPLEKLEELMAQKDDKPSIFEQDCIKEAERLGAPPAAAPKPAPAPAAPAAEKPAPKAKSKK
ncbi:MAG: hypothetical protein MOGMAGMI_01981 [Candidatus Omnitrophica bacterium]|nr:hypothetical protein [Candidatus Omnitrophota bacterium]